MSIREIHNKIQKMKLIPVFVLMLLIISCQQKGKEPVSYDMAGKDMKVAVRQQAQRAPSPSPSPVDKIEKQEVVKTKIIKDGRMKIRVSELEKTKLRIDSLIKKYEGYYAKENFNTTDHEISYFLKIRIPGNRFEKFISAIESGAGEIQYKEIDARDVTDEFIDLETRLENKGKYLKRYNDLLQQANSVKDILEIEEKIRRLEEEIESTTGRLNYLSDLVDYSTLDLILSERKPFRYSPIDRDNFFEQAKQSLSKGWYGLVDFLLFLIKIWPFWVIVGLLLFFLIKKKRR